jgi:hypothetical protein
MGARELNKFGCYHWSAKAVLLVVLLLSFYTTFALILTIIKSVFVIKEMIEKNIVWYDIKKSNDPSYVN